LLDAIKILGCIYRQVNADKFNSQEKCEFGDLSLLIQILPADLPQVMKLPEKLFTGEMPIPERY
jgi:hypothetical protein